VRLLPVIEIKEFKDFFDNPISSISEGLTGWWQRFAFAGFAVGLAIVGWVMSAILVAAVAGLTQGS
jgi:hypothetical protein